MVHAFTSSSLNISEITNAIAGAKPTDDTQGPPRQPVVYLPLGMCALRLCEAIHVSQRISIWLEFLIVSSYLTQFYVPLMFSRAEWRYCRGAMHNNVCRESLGNINLNWLLDCLFGCRRASRSDLLGQSGPFRDLHFAGTCLACLKTIRHLYCWLSCVTNAR